MPIYLDETRNSLSPLTDYQSGFGEYVGAKAVGAFLESPTAMAGQVAAVQDAQHGTDMLEQMFDNSISSAEFGMKYAGKAPRQVTMIPAEDARKKISEAGVKLTVPDSGISAEALDILITNQQDRTARNSIIERSPTGLRSVAGFGAAFAGSLLDPLNIATGLVPIVGEARYTALLAQSAGSFAGRTAIRAGVGFTEGVVGAAAIEPMMINFNRQLQNDYTMTDSLLNVAFGGVFGGGLHTLGGGFGEGLRNYGGKQHPWEAYKGLGVNDAMTVMKFQNDLMAGKVEDVGAATAGWTDRMREAAGIKGGELPPQVREAGFQPIEQPEAPFARLYETTPESARALALNDLRETIRADLLGVAGNRAENGDIATLRQQLADTQSKLAALDEADFKRRAKEFQQQGMSRKEAESAARKQVEQAMADLEATKTSIEQKIDSNAKASQAEQQLAALDKGEVPPAYEAMVQARADKIMAGADMARATLQMDQLPAPFVIGMASPQTRQVALSTAVAHLAQGQNVNIEPVFHIDAGKMTPEQVIAAAKRQQQPSASALADEASSTQANERVQRSTKKDANLEAATKAADEAVERLNKSIKNLEESGASPEMIERLRKEAEALYSRGESVGSTVEETTAALRDSFNGEGGKLIDSGAVKIVQTVDELPARADGQPHPADTKGMYDGKQAYLVADNLGADEAQGVLLHEVGAHYGMEQMLGAGLYRKLVKEVQKRAAAGEAGFVDALRQVPDDTPEHQLADEILAYLVQNHKELPLVKRIMAAIKAFIYRVTNGSFGNLSPDDIGQMAVAALKKVSSAEAAANGMMYSNAAKDITKTAAFKQWFGSSQIVDENGKPLVMYHGTAQDIHAFRGKQAGAIFVTKDPKFADDFTEMSKDWMVEHHEEILTREQFKAAQDAAERYIREEFANDPDKADMLAHEMRVGDRLTNIKARSLFNKALAEQMPSGPNILPVYVSAQRPFDYENPQHVAAVVAELNKSTNAWGDPRGEKAKGFIERGNWEEIEKMTTQDAIKAAGFDGFYVKEGKEKNLAVYDPAQIKSVFNKGSFDPNNPEISYARGAKQAIEAQGGDVREVAPLDQIVTSERIPMITLKDLIGKRIIPTIADRTKAGALFTGIDGSKLEAAVPLLGGPNFPLRESNMDAGVVWANRGKSVTSLKKGKMDEGAEYMMVVLGSPDMHQSNTTVSNAMIGQLEAYLRDRRLSKKSAADLTNLIRTTKEADPNVAEALSKFPSLEDSEKAISYLDSISFEARKRVATILSSVKASDMGAPNFQKILDATVEPEYAGNRWGDGVLVVKLNRENPFITLGEDGTQLHPDYPLGMKGEVVGKLSTPVNYELLWQDWLAKAHADAIARGTPAEKINTRRAFELGKPMVEVTADLVQRIGNLNSGNLTPRQAKLVSATMNDRWATSETFGKGGMRSASPTEFWHEMQRSQASAIMPRLEAKEIVDQVRAKTRTIYQLDDGAKEGPASRIYFSLRREEKRVVLDSWLNNEVGAKGYGGATIAKAVAEGATHAEVLAVPTVGHPMGRTVELLKALGFEVDKAKKADLGGKANRADALEYFKRNGWKEGEPEPQLVTLKWSGKDEQRAGFAERYLSGDFAGLRPEGAADHVLAAAHSAEPSNRRTARGGRSGEPDTRANEGDQGQSGAPVGSELRQLAATIGQLSDTELLNLGLTRSELGRIADAEFHAKLVDEVKSITKAFDEGVKDAQGLGEAVNAAAVCGLRN